MRKQDSSENSDDFDNPDLLLHPKHPKHPKSIDAGRRIELACEMAEAGVMMMREKICREHPALTQEEVTRRLHEWLLTRPGAKYGDGFGRPTYVRGDKANRELK